MRSKQDFEQDSSCAKGTKKLVENHCIFLILSDNKATLQQFQLQMKFQSEIWFYDPQLSLNETFKFVFLSSKVFAQIRFLDLRLTLLSCLRWSSSVLIWNCEKFTSENNRQFKIALGLSSHDRFIHPRLQYFKTRYFIELIIFSSRFLWQTKGSSCIWLFSRTYHRNLWQFGKNQPNAGAKSILNSFVALNWLRHLPLHIFFFDNEILI
jgi:hypothetical protein